MNTEYDILKASLYSTLDRLPVTLIPLRKIIPDTASSLRMHEFNEVTVEEPVILTLDELTGLYTVIDGRHRIYYAKMTEKLVIHAKIVPYDILDIVNEIKSKMVQALNVV